MLKLNEEDIENFKKAFDLFDKDGNGNINKQVHSILLQEIETVFKELNIKLSVSEVDRIIKIFDENGDNCIQFN